MSISHKKMLEKQDKFPQKKERHRIQILITEKEVYERTIYDT